MAPNGVRPTALVTGAASGIGAEFGRQLADRHFDLVLVDRDANRLDVIANEMQRTTPAACTVLVADLATDAGRQAVIVRLEQGVQFLVNSAGFGVPGLFWELDNSHLQAELDVAVTTVMRLTRAALPSMVAARDGAIINVASVAGLIPGPAAGYSAAKAYVVFLCEGLSKTLVGSGVRIQALCPGFVRTAFHESAGFDVSRLPQPMWLSAHAVVAASFKDLDAGKTVSIPGAQYKALVLLTRLSPRWLTTRAGNRMVRRPPR